jgi:hypothetical protein
MSVSYQVPGVTVVIAQASSNACWATVYAMMRSWKDQTEYDVAGAIAKVPGDKWLKYLKDDKGLPPEQFGPFLNAAHMAHPPMMNLTIDEWVGRLQKSGLLWVGTLSDEGGGLHSRIIEAINGDGEPDGTKFNMIDPMGGKRYAETFALFKNKYEGALQQAGKGEYYQIRHFH